MLCTITTGLRLSDHVGREHAVAADKVRARPARKVALEMASPRLSAAGNAGHLALVPLEGDCGASDRDPGIGGNAYRPLSAASDATLANLAFDTIRECGRWQCDRASARRGRGAAGAGPSGANGRALLAHRRGVAAGNGSVPR